MLFKILFIVTSVAIFGILFFLMVKKSLKKKLDYLVKNEKKNNLH